MDNLFDLRGKVAVVTGSSRGIGRSIALRLAQHGARVVVSSRKAEACEKVAAEIREAGGEALVVPCNISEKAQLQALVDAAHQAWGRIDVLVCNAAVNPYFGPSQNIPDDAFDKIMQCNIKSNHWLCNMVAPGMAERGEGGAIIIISSIGGLIGSSLLGAYGISKAADMALARNLAVEWGPAQIRANCIAPGLIKTDFARALWENPDIAKRATQGYALKRIGDPDEIAGAAVFLASRAGSFTTGQTLVIDGGGMINMQSV
ncbi:SDR family NAD(P)-dependent oxidoreductase [Ferrovibrio sp.]|uniref:SDR family NAD(P)-dependent oxidoreductase n=1 Tax=Ferrovibrio sp. TaxID=1917215 RepID=UPI003D0F1ADC